MKFSASLGFLFGASSACTSAFVVNQPSALKPTHLFSSKDFEKESFGKTYGEDVAPIKDLIDTGEAAMKEFFSSNEEWMPLFRNLVDSSSSVPAMSCMDGVDAGDFDFHETSSPWRKLEAIPTDDKAKAVLANFLDNLQTSLIDIPVDESTEEDENDLHFLEEGRRMLVVSRFHVVQETEKGSIESYDALFRTCWSELVHLRREDEDNTGSLIVVPDTDLADLRRFTDMNLQRPLQWLGVDSHFEVASLQRGSPAIRLIHKLSEMPTDIPDGPEEEDEE
jgi:hypothetical protein